MKLTVTAEGIETDRQRSSLRELNCDYGQGFLFSQAVKAKDVIFKDNVKQIKKGNPDSRDTA
jgi:EAL domain-containing protein (putative c-di-GMP-specific phosphodiesterase class I)